MIKVRGYKSFLLIPQQCFGEQSADRSIDDSYIIAQMEVGGFHKLGPFGPELPSSALFLSFSHIGFLSSPRALS